ncbi:TPA: hypothetical protein ACH3X1_015830 [Trebouxia sp. C0004]
MFDVLGGNWDPTDKKNQFSHTKALIAIKLFMITYAEWRAKYVASDENGLYVNYNAQGLSHPKDAITVSEASGYGLLASVLSDQRGDFDQFLLFYNHFENSQGLMCWQQVKRNGKILTNPDEDANATSSAPDGDLDAAYALLLAGRKWQHRPYTERGEKVCAALWKWCINKDTFITNLGDWCLTSTGLQANAPSNKYHFVSRASDYMLTHFKLFSEEDTERAKEWKQVLDSTIAVLQHQLSLHPQTGLLADFMVYNHSEQCYKPCEGKMLEKDNDGEYNWNSCRAPWRLAVYYLQSRDERILPLLQAQLCFFGGQKLISAGYKLDGTALADYSNIAFQAPVWCLFKVMGSSKASAIAKDMDDMRAWGHGTYYGESVEVLAALQVQSC